MGKFPEILLDQEVQTVKRLYKSEEYKSRKFEIDYCCVNGQTPANLLTHFLRINSIQVQNFSNRPKENLIQTANSFLKSKNLPALPILFVLGSNKIFPLPIKVDALTNKANLSESNSALKPHGYKELFSAGTLKINLNTNQLSLLHPSEFPPFLDYGFCLDFLSLSLDLAIPAIYELTPRSQWTQSRTDFSTSGIIEYNLTETESSESVDLLNTNVVKSEPVSSENMVEDSGAKTEKSGDSEIAAQAALESQQTIDELKQMIEDMKKTAENEKSEKIAESSKNTSDKSPKLKVTEWHSFEKSGDPLDWLKVNLFLVAIERGSLSDGAIIQLLLSAIKAVDLRLKLIDEMKKTESSPDKLTLKIFEQVFMKNVKRDQVTYTNQLKSLKYKDSFNLREFYSRLYGLVAKSMELCEEKDHSSIEKLAMQKFIEKMPKTIQKSLQTAIYENGFALADLAEKIRSYERLYCENDSLELNHVAKKDQQSSSHKKPDHK